MTWTACCIAAGTCACVSSVQCSNGQGLESVLSVEPLSGMLSEPTELDKTLYLIAVSRVNQILVQRFIQNTKDYLIIIIISQSLLLLLILVSLV